MNPILLGEKYDKIADWRSKNHDNSKYGIDQVEKALSFCESQGIALDVGCGAGGRMVHLLEKHGFSIVGVDVSAQMIKLASENHPDQQFNVADICRWETRQKFQLILAWDSIFHLPLTMHKTVIIKLCDSLAPGGVIVYSFGDAIGEHIDTWHSDEFYYSSIGLSENLRLLDEAGVTCKHLELDQWPENHVYLIGEKTAK